MWKEIFRKSIHICGALIPLFLYWNKPVTLILLLSAIIIFTICEILRLNGRRVFLISKITETAARKRDENRFVLGPVTLASGIFITALIFPLQNATAGIFALAFGDGLASIGGKLLGKRKLPFTKGKTLEGSLTCFLAVFISILVYSKNPFCALILAFFAMIIEMLPLFDFDNLIIPIGISLLSLLFI